jgi:hypothetical protein
MGEHDLFRRLDRVTAPADFEARVGVLLARRRAARARDVRSRAFRYSLAGAAAMLLAAFVLINTVFIRPGGVSSGLAERGGPGSAASLPVMETVNYRHEARNASLHPEAMYILENVSYASDSRIRY